MASRRTIILVGICLVPLAVAVVISLIGSDEQTIERIVDECRLAALEGEPDGVLRHLEEGAEGGDWLGDGPLEPKVRYWVEVAARRLEDIDLDQRELDVDGDDARGVWMIDLTFKRRELMRKARLKATIDFHRGPDGWRIRKAVIGRP